MQNEPNALALEELDVVAQRRTQGGRRKDPPTIPDPGFPPVILLPIMPIGPIIVVDVEL